MARNENELIDALIASDESAFRQAIGEYQSPMRYLARSIAGDSIADEVVQEAWVSALRALPKFERRSSLKTWLLRIVANEAKTRLRRENRMTSLDAMTQPDHALDGRFDGPGHWGDEVPLEWDADSPDELLSSDELHTLQVTSTAISQGALN